MFSEPQHSSKADLHGSNTLEALQIAAIPEGRFSFLVGTHQLRKDAIGRCKEVCGRIDRRLQGRRSGGLTLNLDLLPLEPVEIYVDGQQILQGISMHNLSQSGHTPTVYQSL
jgi:hypothetical protein